MKKVLFAILMAVSLTAFAGEYMDLGLGSFKNLRSEQRSTYGIAAYGQTFGNFEAEGRVLSTRTNDTSINSNAGEARLRYTLPIGDFRFWARGTLGESFPNAAGRFGYWAVEPGLGYMVTKDLRLDGSVRRTEAFHHNVNVESTAWIGGATYALDQKNAVSLWYVDSHDNVRANAVEVGYTHKF